MSETFSIETQRGSQCIDITARVVEAVGRAGVASGLCHVMVLHSTAAVIVNESADPNIGVDVITALDRAVPERGDWLHDRIDDNAHAHIKGSILGPSELLPIRNGELVLGTWQSVLLLEFDGPRKRSVSVQILAAGA
ncbi:MAG: secondary thiamine-phosphate synthase enzyme YjbQ [Myxococcota bacterium]